jgi:hypothetical protein
MEPTDTQLGEAARLVLESEFRENLGQGCVEPFRDRGCTPRRRPCVCCTPDQSSARGAKAAPRLAVFGRRGAVTRGQAASRVMHRAGLDDRSDSTARLGGALTSPIAHIAYGVVGTAVLTAPLRDLEPRDHVGSLPESEPRLFHRWLPEPVRGRFGH